MEKLPTYLGLKSDFYTHVHDLPPQIGGESVIARLVGCWWPWLHLMTLAAHG